MQIWIFAYFAYLQSGHMQIWIFAYDQTSRLVICVSRLVQTGHMCQSFQTDTYSVWNDVTSSIGHKQLKEMNDI